MSTVGERLKTLREGTRFSQKALAQKIGITQSSLNRYENNQSQAPYQTLLQYADYFDVSMDYIFARTDQPQGRLYDFKPKLEDNKEMQAFIEMCFDPNSPMNEQLKETLARLLKEAKE